MFHGTGTAHGKWSKACFNALYEKFCIVFPRVNEYFIIFGWYTENHKYTSTSCEYNGIWS